MFHRIGLLLAWSTAAITLNGVAIAFSILASIAVIIASLYKIRLDRQTYESNLKKGSVDPTKEPPIVRSSDSSN